MNKFNDIAKRATSQSRLMEGKEKVTTEELIKYEKLHIIDFDMMKNEDGDGFYIINIDEVPNGFAFTGKVLSTIFDSFIESYQGDFEECHTDFIKSGGIIVKLSERKSKSGKRYTAVTVID